MAVRRSRRRVPATGLWLDVKLGARMQRKQPVLTEVAALTLALGIPAGLLPLHIMDSITATLPVEHGDRVVRVWNCDVVDSRRAGESIHDREDWREALGSFEDLGFVRSRDYNLVSQDGLAAPVRGAEIVRRRLIRHLTQAELESDPRWDRIRHPLAQHILLGIVSFHILGYISQSCEMGRYT